MSDVKPIKRALISVSDKTGIVDLASRLHENGIDLISTGGTAKLLGNHGIPVTAIETYTGSPEILDGRVKTLHPKVFAGLLGRGKRDEQLLDSLNIPTIDLLVVNLYPFVDTIRAPHCTHEQAIENIDVGGPSMLRAAAKNYHEVCVLSSTADYDGFLEELKSNGTISLASRKRLARKVFMHTQAYDAAIAHYLTDDTDEVAFPDHLALPFQKAYDLRYGENPHQPAALYVANDTPDSLANCQQLQGKALSYNNFVDADAALQCVSSFGERAACVIVKHANPCGVACADGAYEAYQRAYATDSISAFGGIIAFNTTLDEKTAQAIIEQQFVEVILAPAVTDEAQLLLAKKPNLRILVCQANPDHIRLDLKTIAGGLLVQQHDSLIIDPSQWETVTQNQASPEQMNDLIFAWHVVKYIKSNAIVYARDGATLGIGAGQMSRVFSADIAQQKAERATLSIEQAVMASDAFFPFKDSIELAAQQGISAIIQPGGSKRDAEVIEAANKAGIVMILTGSRHFRH